MGVLSPPPLRICVEGAAGHPVSLSRVLRADLTHLRPQLMGQLSLLQACECQSCWGFRSDGESGPRCGKVRGAVGGAFLVPACCAQLPAIS